MRSLIPGVLPGHTAEDIVTAKADYTVLDKPTNRIRIRLSSLAVKVTNVGAETANPSVDVTYTRDGKLHTASAPRSVLACWNMMIPYLCPEMTDKQKDALHYLVKTPLVYTTVAISNWRAFETLGISNVYAPGSFHTGFGLNPTVDIGDYKSSRSPDEPILIRMFKTPCKPLAGSERDQNRIGRAELLNTSFETFERNIRDQLQRTLGPGGFDAAKDITGITVNRWPHGYAYEYNPLFDPDWTEREQPHVIGRTPFGRITIANSDAGAQAYTDSAIDQAFRAVQESFEIG